MLGICKINKKASIASDEPELSHTGLDEGTGFGRSNPIMDQLYR